MKNEESKKKIDKMDEFHICSLQAVASTSQRWKRVKTELLELASPRKATSCSALICIKEAVEA